MLSIKFALLAMLSASQAATPPGFEPVAHGDMAVIYPTMSAHNGNELSRNETENMPRLATRYRLNATSFAIIMVDIDIPSSGPTQPRTLLHWLQTGVTQEQTPVASNGSSGYLFSMPTTQPEYPYRRPNPPPLNPLSHRYVFLMVDTSNTTQAGLNVLRQSVAQPFGWDPLSVLTQAGLANRVIAGNYYNVTNPGPANGTVAGNSTTATAAGTGIAGGPTSTATNIVTGGAAQQSISLALLGVGMMAAMAGLS